MKWQYKMELYSKQLQQLLLVFHWCLLTSRNHRAKGTQNCFKNLLSHGCFSTSNISSPVHNRWTQQRWSVGRQMKRWHPLSAEDPDAENTGYEHVSETPARQHWHPAELVRITMLLTGYFSAEPVPYTPTSDYFFVSHTITHVFPGA